MDKLTYRFQSNFSDQLIFDQGVFDDIDPDVILHGETKGNPLSSSAACLNVLGSLRHNPTELMAFLNQFGLEIDRLHEFPDNCIVGGRTYHDKGYVVFEWVGPLKSPINEKQGVRGKYITSVDAFIIAVIKGKITQLLIEWKFVEGLYNPLAMEKFSGYKGLVRLKSYSDVLLDFRGKDDFPFKFSEEKGMGLFDFSVDHLYQLLRITLLAKKTTPIQIGHLKIEDYRVVHLSHSANKELEILHDKYLKYSPGLKDFAGEKLYDVWFEILSPFEKGKFKFGHWDEAIKNIQNEDLRKYLLNRYECAQSKQI